MTLILGAKDKSGVYIGSDSRATSSNYYFDASHKLIRVKNYVIGYTASFRTAQIIEFNKSKFKPIDKRKDVYEFVQSLRDLMIENGNKDKTDNKEELEHNNVQLLLATKFQLYIIFGNYQFDAVKRAGIGSGGTYAVGYFDAYPETDMQKRIKNTIDKTSGYVPSVGGKTTVWKV